MISVNQKMNTLCIHRILRNNCTCYGLLWFTKAAIGQYNCSEELLYGTAVIFRMQKQVRRIYSALIIV